MIEVEYNGNNVYNVKKGDKVKEMDFIVDLIDMIKNKEDSDTDGN